MSDVTLPRNTDAERALVGSVFLDGEILLVLQDQVTPADFSEQPLGWVFEAQLACMRKRTRPDVIAVADELRRRDQLDAVGGVPGLIGLSNDAPMAYMAHVYAEIVRSTAALRRLFHAGQRIAALAYNERDGIDLVLSRAQAHLNEVQQGVAFAGMVDMNTVVDDMDREQSASMSGANAAGFDTELIDLRRHVGNFRNSEMILVTSPSGTGKSTLLGQWVYKCASRGQHAGIYSLEMKRGVLGRRWLAGWFKANHKDLNVTYTMVRDAVFTTAGERYRVDRGEMREADLRRLEDRRIAAVEEGKAHLRSLPISVDHDRSLTIDQIRLRALRAQAERGPFALLGLDYGQLIEATGKHATREQDVAEVADKVLRLADDLGCPVVCLGQQNDDGKVRESRRWFNNCHIELRLQRREQEDNVTDMHITKARDGVTGTVPLVFDGEHQMFLSYAGMSPEGY